MRWRPGITVGTRIRAGVILAHIRWRDGLKESVKAPPGCNGVIARRNRSIVHEMLHLRSQFLLEIQGA
jgi:hypothetical protein